MINEREIECFMGFNLPGEVARALFMFVYFLYFLSRGFELT